MIHNITTWFSEWPNPREYFDTHFEQNTIGTFKIPRSSSVRFPEQAGLDTLFKSLANIAISAINKMKPILRQVDFNQLEALDQHQLRQAVCSMVQFLTTNNYINQVVNASSIATGNFTINMDSSAWLMVADQLGKRAQTLLQNSELDLYEIIEEDVLYRNTPSGNIKIISTVEDI